MSLDPDVIARWKADTAAAYTRLIVLDERAQDDGLTDDEREEYDRLQGFTGRRLAELLAETRDADGRAGAAR